MEPNPQVNTYTRFAIDLFRTISILCRTQLRSHLSDLSRLERAHEISRSKHRSTCVDSKRAVVRNNFVLTAQDNGLPSCENRRERQPVVRKDTFDRSEIGQIDIPQQPRGIAQPHGVLWEWFGEAKIDPTWDARFDDLEQHREATREVE